MDSGLLAANRHSSAPFEALDQLAGDLRQPQGLGELARVVDRWVYSACLCFGLDRPAQERSQFPYSYSCYLLENTTSKGHPPKINNVKSN